MLVWKGLWKSSLVLLGYFSVKGKTHAYLFWMILMSNIEKKNHIVTFVSFYSYGYFLIPIKFLWMMTWNTTPIGEYYAFLKYKKAELSLFLRLLKKAIGSFHISTSLILF